MTTIRISGLGETMAAEIFVIKNALEEAGFNVTIDDKCPCDDMTHIDRIISSENKADVHIKVDHLPWGG